MKLEWEIFLWILARCIFIALPDTYVDPFPFSDDGMPLSSYGWVMIEMAFLCRLAYKWCRSETKHFKTAVLLLCFLMFDWAHFILFSNSAYKMIGSYPLTNNVIMLIAWGIYVLIRENTRIDL
jgi:hypothetical protein